MVRVWKSERATFFSREGWQAQREPGRELGGARSGGAASAWARVWGRGWSATLEETGRHVLREISWVKTRDEPLWRPDCKLR